MAKQSLKLKAAKCKACGVAFQKYNSLQKACSLACSDELAKIALQKKWRQDKKEYYEKNPKRGDLVKKAQDAFNEFIRLRDHGQPCISCGEYRDKEVFKASVYDCGHYLSVGAAPELRFEELNAHKQCVYCNRDLSGNAVKYRSRLIEKIGSDRLAWLEGPHKQKKYTHDELREIAKRYRQKSKEIKNQIEANV